MIFGYIISMVVGFAYGRRIQSRLHDVSEYLFPTVQESQLALTSFDEGIKLYEDAYLLSEISRVESATEKIEKAQNVLQAIIELRILNPQKETEVRKVLNHLKNFGDSAQITYTKMVSEDVFEDEDSETGEDLEEKASALAQEKEISLACKISFS